MNLKLLIGILVVAMGFALRFNTLLVVMAAGISTGLVAGMSFNEIMELFGKYFVENRYITLTVVLMLPVVGLLERYGLRERAETLIKRAKSATAGRVLIFYTAVRQISIALGVNIGGHTAMVRPLVSPMAEAAAKLQFERAALPAEGAARARFGVLPEKTTQAIRAHAAAAENTGNFFGEDTVFAVGAVYLIKGVLEAQGLQVSVWALSLWGIPTALVAFSLLAWRAHLLDRRIAREVAAEPKPGGPP
ncbi:MAG TPA: DUF969 domain-containing protein [Lacunisphaera sp.]|nr:DUF969 domain-containing protein [Lacunisphaera sp.]